LKELVCRYVEVDEGNGVRLFYYFVRSERSPADDPLMLWLTGGPGCSVLTGLAYEIGIGFLFLLINRATLFNFFLFFFQHTLYIYNLRLILAKLPLSLLVNGNIHKNLC
jgi:hypothetical protein